MLDLLYSIKIKLMKNIVFILLMVSFSAAGQQKFTIAGGSGGSGFGVVTPVGTNFKIGVDNTANIKGILAGLYTNVDSATANSVKIGVDSSAVVTKATAQVISAAKNFTSASNKFSGLSTDNTATKFVVAATDGTFGTQTLLTASAYAVVDSLIGGEYTPTLVNNPAGYNSNVSASSHVTAYYHKIGNIVFFGGTITATATAGSTNSAVAITLPFASDLAAGDITGGAEWNVTVGVNYQDFDAAINTDATNDRIVVGFISHAATALHNISYWGSYQVK